MGKRCSKCGEVKDAGEFGRHNVCKICEAERYRKWAAVAVNKEKLRKLRKQWEAKHPERAKRMRKYKYKYNPVKFRKSNKLYRLRHPDKIKVKGLQWQNKAWKELSNGRLRAYIKCKFRITGVINQTVIDYYRERLMAIRKFRELKEELKNVSMDGNL